MELYARPYRAHEPVICIDEKSKQLIRDSRLPISMRAGVPAKCDYEYVRTGTCNVFVAAEPRAGRRVAEVTQRRTKPEFVGFVQRLLEDTYASARKVHLGLGQSEHPLLLLLRAGVGSAGGARTAATGTVSLHAQTR